MEWKKVKLGEVVSLYAKTITPKKDIMYNLYSLPAFDNGEKEQVLGKSIQSNKFVVPNKCILYNKLNVRFKRVWRIDTTEQNKICSTEFLPLVVNETIVDYQYLYYVLISDDITSYLCGQNTNTSGSHKRIDITDFLNIEVNIPSYKEQMKIGQCLSALDRKIALNRAINHNLEAIAKQLYDYWFVQFDFPDSNGRPYKSSGGEMVWNEKLKREIPKGWEILRLAEWMEIKSGFSFSSKKYTAIGRYKVITIKNVQENHLDTSTCDYINELPDGIRDHCILSVGDSLISLTGNCGRICFVTEDNLLLNQRVGLLSCSTKYRMYAHLLLTSKEFQEVCINLASGAAQANLSPIDLCKTYASKPPTNIIDKFNNITNPIKRSFIKNEQEISSLTALRDKLLPLLMNGQVSVKSE